MHLDDKDKNLGLYGKYRVERVDGSSEPGGKHEGCRYFVLDLDHDPSAIPAIRAYALNCWQDYPKLAEDLWQICRAAAKDTSLAGPDIVVKEGDLG